MKKWLLIGVLSTLGCAGAQRPDSAQWVSATRAPEEAFQACEKLAPGESCTVRVGEVEATGSCAPPPSSVRDHRLICST
jgi:hypothetical protein